MLLLYDLKVSNEYTEPEHPIRNRCPSLNDLLSGRRLNRLLQSLVKGKGYDRFWLSLEKSISRLPWPCRGHLWSWSKAVRDEKKGVKEEKVRREGELSLVIPTREARIQSFYSQPWDTSKLTLPERYRRWTWDFPVAMSTKSRSAGCDLRSKREREPKQKDEVRRVGERAQRVLLQFKWLNSFLK